MGGYEHLALVGTTAVVALVGEAALTPLLPYVRLCDASRHCCKLVAGSLLHPCPHCYTCGTDIPCTAGPVLLGSSCHVLHWRSDGKRHFLPWSPA